MIKARNSCSGGIDGRPTAECSERHSPGWPAYQSTVGSHAGDDLEQRTARSTCCRCKPVARCPIIDAVSMPRGDQHPPIRFPRTQLSGLPELTTRRAESKIHTAAYAWKSFRIPRDRFSPCRHFYLGGTLQHVLWRSLHGHFRRRQIASERCDLPPH